MLQSEQDVAADKEGGYGANIRRAEHIRKNFKVMLTAAASLLTSPPPKTIDFPCLKPVCLMN